MYKKNHIIQLIELKFNENMKLISIMIQITSLCNQLITINLNK